MEPQPHKMRQWNFPRQQPDIFCQSPLLQECLRADFACSQDSATVVRNCKPSSRKLPNTIAQSNLIWIKANKGNGKEKEYQRQVMKAPTKEAKHIIQGEISNPRSKKSQPRPLRGHRATWCQSGSATLMARPEEKHSCGAFLKNTLRSWLEGALPKQLGLNYASRPYVKRNMCMFVTNCIIVGPFFVASRTCVNMM